MTRFDKNVLYDAICYALTRYENPNENDSNEDFVKGFYDLLVMVVNTWDELTGEDD